MITESFHEHKGFIIRLRFVTSKGGGYSIIKQKQSPSSPDGVKNIYLRKKEWVFINPYSLLGKAIDYINEFENELNTKFDKHVD